MTARADIVARITDRVQFVSGAAPGTIAHDRPLIGQAFIDSLDIADIAMGLEEEFATQLDLANDWTIDGIADAVMAARA